MAFVYVWSAPDGVPFYVGAGKTQSRWSPATRNNRNVDCLAVLDAVGAQNVRVDVIPQESMACAWLLEYALIDSIGRIDLGTGTLTNRAAGGRHPSAFGPPTIALLRAAAMRQSNMLRMHGSANPAKQPEVREKLRAVWKDPAYQASQRAKRTGLTRDLSEDTKGKLRTNLKNNEKMQPWGERALDPAFVTARVAGLTKPGVQERRAEKMRDPAALAQRKARLSATMRSPEYAAKKALWDTPEYRKKLSDAKKAYWAAKRSGV